MYRTIDASFWTDLKVRGNLSPTARYLFLYYVTNPHTHVSGLYYLPDVMAQHETGLTAKALYVNQNALITGGFCLFDRERQLVWVRKMMHHQGKGLKNTLSAAHHISRDVHNSFLVNEFLKLYPEVNEHLKDRVSNVETLVPLPIPHSPFPITENGEQRTDSTPNGADALSQPEVLTLGEFGKVKLTRVEHDKLNSKLGQAAVVKLIDQLDRYSQTNPARFRKYKSHYATLLSWNDKNSGSGNLSPPVLSAAEREAAAKKEWDRIHGRA